METEPDSPGFSPELKLYISDVVVVGAAAAVSYSSGAVFLMGILGVLGLALFRTRVLTSHCSEAAPEAIPTHTECFTGQSLADLDEISGGIAHEINNPLGIIAQETEWMRHIMQSESLQEAPEYADLSDSLREISEQVDRCKEIIRKLLNLAHESEPIIQCVDINELVSNLAEIVTRTVTDKNITIQRDLENTAPVVHTDPPLLRQVVLNLMVNAVHAVDHDGVISVVTSSQTDSVEIAVKDTGPGIPEEDLNKIFLPFYSTKPQGQGTGLGLAFSRGIIERLGGTICVTSELGKGSSFTLKLPIQRPV